MSGYMRDMDEQLVTTGLDFLFEVAVMRWTQESSDATPCGKHRAQVLDSLRIWCQRSLPESFRAREDLRDVFVPFRTISGPFLRELFAGRAFLSEHCPSYRKVIKLPTYFIRSLVSLVRNPASGSSWMELFNHDEARDLSMTSDWTPCRSFRTTPSVLVRGVQDDKTGDQDVTTDMAIDGDVTASAPSVPLCVVSISK